MPVVVKTLISAKFAEPSQSAQYTANDVKASIDKFTATNVSASDVDFSVNIVENGDSASNSNKITPARTIGAGEAYTCPELIGHILEAGAYITTLAGAADSIVIRASGREIT